MPPFRPFPNEVLRPLGAFGNAWIVRIVLFFGFLPLTEAMIFYSSADPNFNTTAPTGALVNSGWQWVGTWGGFQGAPIGPHHFLAARHVGGAVGESFIFEGVSYVTTASFDDSASDLRIWEISGTFPTWAPLYRQTDEVGRGLVVFGRGLMRGAEVRETATNKLRGWQWGSSDGRLRWGQNVVASTANGGSYWGELLYATFDAAGGTNEAHLATGDSSGPIFINDGTAWKLAGVAATVDAYFNTTNTDTSSGFNAAIFDARGLYYGSPGSWNFVTGTKPVPSSFYGTRVSVRAGWIDSVVPPPVATIDSDVPLISPSTSLIFVMALLGIGVVSLRRGQESPQS